MIGYFSYLDNSNSRAYLVDIMTNETVNEKFFTRDGAEFTGHVGAVMVSPFTVEDDFEFARR